MRSYEGGTDAEPTKISRPRSGTRAADDQSIRIKSLFRDGQGNIHLDWPKEKLEEALKDEKGTLWVDLFEDDPECFGNIEKLLRDVFKFHPLAIEDALCETHITKLDDWGEYLYLVFHTLEFDEDTDFLRVHELDVFLGKNYVVTFHNTPIPSLQQLHKNIEREPNSRLRNGADYVLYHILDTIVADYLPVIEHLDEAIDAAQDEVFRKPTRETLQSIFRVKRSALRFHRLLAPVREVLNRLARDEYDPIQQDHRVFFRDVYDHIVRVQDIAETLRDLIAGALDTYLSAISNRTNDIMKAMTLATVMFLPMSFLTSFFGMNFFGDNLVFQTPLPRFFLFFGSCLIMLSTPIGMYLWAKHRRWF
ncbi:magnesium/cobalt transporter CorA [Singulisphaera sp. PoT]|uniref:magnesium/cobalt transporter CorA n=1 Tax=Singulisphaera sp. PoT TaxID=3411797 RepID=UPI003BF4B335